MSSTSTSSSSTSPSLERSFRGHTGVVHSISFNPSLTQLASGGEDQLIYVWNFKPQLRAFKYTGHTGKSIILTIYIYIYDDNIES